MNFVYCIDEKFNIQCAVAIYSLLKNVNKKISIHILHSYPESFDNYLEYFVNEQNCNEITMYKVETDVFNFPNLDNSHVSAATYFRLFIERYVNCNEVIVYLDADTVVKENPLELLNNQIKSMRLKGYYFGAAKETTKENSIDIFERLELQGENYFNAGVMILDLNNPKSKNLTDDLLNLLKNLSGKIKHWDQDILNKYFDNNYFQLDQNLNFKLFDEGNMPTNSSKILHYLGSKKPWTFEGLKISNSIYYQQYYRELFDKSLFHVTSKWKIKTYLDLIIYVFTLRIFRKKEFFKLFLSIIKVKKF